MPPAFWQSAAGPLHYLLAVAVSIAMLSLGQEFIVPVALAAFLAFVLSPAVTSLERRRVPRLFAVGLVLALALTLVGSFAYVLTAQLRDLATEIPRYSTSIKEKLATLRYTRKGAIADIQKTVEHVTNELDKQEHAAERQDPDHVTPETVRPVRVVADGPSDLEMLGGMVTLLVEPLAKAGAVVVLIIFMLMRREDLRNRVIRLVGKGRLTLTTLAIDDAGERISRFLLTQSLINATFGLLATAGLVWIGVPYALLWGVAAALLRFVPWVGAVLAVAMPAAIAAVQFEGWSAVAETIALFVGMDVVVANVIEPLLLGARTGVSSIALLVNALFWSWLWGPIGLLLSTPITVWLAVLGKYVPQLEFFAILFGDEPVLEPEISVYQRLLANDEDEANEIVQAALKTAPVAAVLDDVLLPAVIRAARDSAEDEITDAGYAFVLHATSDMVNQLGDADADVGSAIRAETTAVLAVAARNDADELGLDMLAQVVGPQGFRFVRVPPAEAVADPRIDDVAGIVVAALPPGGLAHVRYLCQRLRARYPDLAIVLLRPSTDAPREPVDGVEHAASLVAARERIERMATSRAEAAEQIVQSGSARG